MNANVQTTATTAAPLWKPSMVVADLAAAGGREAFAGLLGQQLLGTAQNDGTSGSILSLEALLSGFSPLMLALLPQTETTDPELAAKQLELLLEQHPELLAGLLTAPGFAEWSAKVDELFAAVTAENAADAAGVQLTPATANPLSAANNSVQHANGQAGAQAGETAGKFLYLLRAEGANPFVQQLSEDLQKLIAEAKPAAGETNAAKQAIEVTSSAPQATASEALRKLQALAAKQGTSFEQLQAASAETQADVRLSGSADKTDASALAFASHNSLSGKAADGASVIAKPVSAQSFVQDMSQFVLKTIKVNTLNGFSEAKLTLTPEHLGQVDVRISLQNGQLVAQFTAQTQLGREMIESQLAHLRSTLAGQGLQVEKIEVSQSASFQSGMFHDGRQQASQQFTQQFNRQSSEGYGQGDDTSFTLEAEASDAATAAAPVGRDGFDATA